MSDNPAPSGFNVPASDVRIIHFETLDLRFPTSLDLSGSDAMNLGPDYSAAHVRLHTNIPNLTGHGISFTLGRGNDLCVNAASQLAEQLVGKTLAELTSNMGATWRYLVSDSQLRWVGPEKGVVHLGLAGVVNALWDLWGRHIGKPVWKLVADMTPEEFVRCIDFRYITDAITPAEAVTLLREQETAKPARLEDVARNRAVPAYTTQAGWLGYTDEKMVELIHSNLKAGMDKFKFKVGGRIEDDKRRLKLARKTLGYDKMLMVDANQVWDVNEAIDYMKQLVKFKPVFIEEPTSPDDILGHLAIRKALEPDGVKVATGECCQNRIMFKQLLQAGATDYCQIDACRLGGVNEVLAVMLMAKKFNVPVLPHSSGIGLTEYTQHLSIINFVSLAGEKALLEHVNSFSEVLVHPVQTADGWFITPQESGYSTEYKPGVTEKYIYPNGSFWTSEQGIAVRNAPRV